MMEQIILWFLGFVLWAVVGHGIWVFSRATFNAMFPRYCPDCGRLIRRRPCPHCSPAAGSVPQQTPSVEDDLRAAERLIKYSRFRGWLDDNQQATVSGLLKGLTAHVRGGQPESQLTATQVAVAKTQVDISSDSATKESSQDQDAVALPATMASQPFPPASADEELVEAELIDATSSDALQSAHAPTAPNVVHPLDQTYLAKDHRRASGDSRSSPGRDRLPISQRLTTSLLKSFMEQSNIHWIELISAALIVVCSVGLVISLWSTLSSTSRFFPSLVFLVATAAVHGAGQYTLRQWKLRSTSRGILHIGLMLIPLAVLVGILLARREGELPRLDAMTVATIAVGTLVYGSLAITASSALFPRRWPFVAAATIAASLSLLPVHYAAEYQQLDEWFVWLLPLPIVIVTQLSALSASRTSMRRVQLPSRIAKRMVGMIVQTCFAASVLCIFWVLEARHGGGLAVAWWMMLAALSAAWSAWALSLGVGSDAAPQPVKTSIALLAHRASPFRSGLLIAGWSWGAVCAMLLLAAIWQLSAARWHLTGLLLIVGLWWLLHGRFCHIKSSLTVGSLALILTSTLAIEGALSYTAVLPSGDPSSPVEELRWVDWLSCSRTMLAATLGLLAVALGSWWGERDKSSSAARRTRSTQFAFTEFAQPLLSAGSVSLALAAVLTLLASLSPRGNTPYGGNWAPLMLALYGLLTSLAAVIKGMLATEVQDDSLADSTQSSPWRTLGLMPIGQALLLFATVRLCQTSPLLADLLDELRPYRAWGVGLVGLATVWSLTASGLRAGWLGSETRQRANIQWLAAGAVACGIASLPAVWQPSEHFELAKTLGWTLPLICLAVSYSWRQTAWREAALIASFAWLSTVVLNIGDWRGWWEAIGSSAKIAPYVATIVATTFAFEALVEWGRGHKSKLDLAVGDPGLAPAQQSPELWWTARPHWGAVVGIALCWLLLLQGLVVPATVHVAQSLGLSAGSWAIRLSDFNGTDFSRGFVVAFELSCGVALTTLGCWLGRMRQQWWLVNLAALLPMFSALIAIAAVAPPFALASGLWVLASWILLSELLPLFGKRVGQLSGDAWEQVIARDKKPTPSAQWLPLTRAWSTVLLLLGSGGYLLAALLPQLPPETSIVDTVSWGSNIWRVALTLAPILLVSGVRWCVAVVAGQSPNMISLSGGMAALSTAAIMAMSLPPVWPDRGIMFVQAAALVAAVLAWHTIGWATLRNFIGLHKLTQGKTPARQLLPKAMKGQRWKQAELASWSLVTLAFMSVCLLGATAAGLVIAYPAVALPGLSGLGGVFGGIVFAVTLTLYCWQARRRGAPRFGLLAVGLGIAAPLIAATVANALIAQPQRKFPLAADFEPYRLLVVLWLVALGVGLTVRVLAMRFPTATTKDPTKDDAQWGSLVGQTMWVVLAGVVGSMALVSISQDPNHLWPLFELSALALIGVLSGVASGQAWRGHLAAIAAAAGMFAWVVLTSTGEPLESLWCVLWGPVWVAAVALGFTLWLRPERQPQWSVDQSVSLHVPVVSAAMSFAWIVWQAPQSATAQMGSIVALSATCLVLACTRLWDARPGKRGLSVYLNLWALALVSSLAFSAWAELPWLHTWLLWMASGLGAMALMAGLLRELVREASQLAPALRLGEVGTPQQLRHALTWMPALHATVGLLALIPSVLLVLALEERSLRVAATVLPFIGACAILPIAIERGKLLYRYCGLLLISATLVLLWWADLPQAWGAAQPSDAWLYVQRAFAALIAVGGVIYPLTVLWLRKPSEWERPLMISGWVALGLGVVAGLGLLTLQLNGQWRVPAATASLSTKLLSLSAWTVVVVRLLQFAARPHSLDRSQSVSTRRAAVYAAQLGLAALCAATYVHFPTLFSGVLAAWWPIVLFVIAMLSAALGQWLQHLGQPIIADPVQRSSLLLPIIPLAGVWWIEPESVPWLWRDWERYWLLLLTAAGLYGLHGWLRRSIELRALSGTLLLASFWTFLHSQPNLRFLEHPQFWLLPPALATLAFVEVNRRRLDAGVVLAARYGAVLVAYLSSTSEIFLDAFEGQLWQPLLLLGLAVGGVMAGIALQVRAFLYCGVAFTAVALLAMVWHAQQAIGQVWPWWVFGIATGIGLIILLGYFEKNRPRVLAHLERLKQWE